MTFQPVVPFGGMAGWAFLARTRDKQQAAFENSPAIKRDSEYFAANIHKVKSAEDLVNDFRLLKVALGAFGLDDDIGNKFFIRKILEEGTIQPDSLSNKMADKRYLEMAKTFGFGDFPIPNTQMSDFGDRILESHHQRQFEIAVGNQDPAMRLSLGLERELEKIVAKNTTADGRWFAVMGNPPLRKVFETALALPEAVGALDIDQQLTIFRNRAERVFGNGEVSQFADPEAMADLRKQFLVRGQVNSQNNAMSSHSVALTLLQSF